MELTFDDFKNRAKDKSLSKWEKIGFPDSYRKDIEKEIFYDVSKKVDLLRENINILDIGCGCSQLVNFFINNSKKYNQQLYLVDSEEMLDNIDDCKVSKNVHLVPGYFPKIFLVEEKLISFDVIIAYSVIQYVFLEQSIFNFIHSCLLLLKPGGSLIIGDIPNFSSRERFLKTNDGEKFMSNINNQESNLKFQHENSERLDDSVVISILSRYRNFGFETYLLPQSNSLPFSNRREDILIIKR
uniref:class I SAM-dependent methyltransferase n=1 Tax=Algoriphagus sp. TaxID=1872435 RepID=UPI00404725C3